MPDIITPSERAAIDRAIAAGVTKHIPTGQMATAVEYILDGSHLVHADGGSNHWRNQKATRYGERAKPPVVTQRRDRVCAMMLQGIKQVDIAAELGISARQVKKHVAVLREAGRLPPCDRARLARDMAEAKMKRADERRQKVLVMWQAGQTWQSIADALGVNFACVKRDILLLRRAGHRKEAA